MHLSILFLQHTLADCPGCFWSWFLWMLAAFALGLGIGRWIWGRYAQLVKEKNKKLKAFKTKNEELEKDFISLKYQLNESEKDNKGLKASLADSASNIAVLGTQLSRLRQENRNEKIVVEKPIQKETVSPIVPSVVETALPKVEDSIEPIRTEKITAKETPIVASVSNHSEKNTSIVAFNTSSNFSDYSPFIKNNNLKVIEGIGPKIEGILNKAGYVTWQDLANADLDALQNIMHDAGPRYRIHSPQTWQNQIQMCIDKNWQGLIDFQQQLYAKKTNQDNIDVLTKIEKLVAKKLGFGNLEMNDLKIIEGIGPKIESLLKIGHINSWEDLTDAPLERLEKILEDGGDRFKLARPSIWPIQAQYALQHDWVKLREYQEKINN